MDEFINVTDPIIRQTADIYASLVVFNNDLRKRRRLEAVEPQQAVTA